RVGTGPRAPRGGRPGERRAHRPRPAVRHRARRPAARGAGAHRARARAPRARAALTVSPARRKTPEDLRSARWVARRYRRPFTHRSGTKQAGFASEEWVGRPVIGILNTWSDANSCHTHFRLRAEEVKRGVWQAGGFPLEMPVLSVGETYMKPTTMLY